MNRAPPVVRSSTKQRHPMRGFLAAVALTLAACGGGSGPCDPEVVPDGVPLISNGFVNFYDCAETPGHAFGIVNVVGQPILALDVTDAAGTRTFPMYVNAGEMWVDEDGSVSPGFYLIRAYGANGRTYARYFRFTADGCDAAYVSNANWEVFP